MKRYRVKINGRNVFYALNGRLCKAEDGIVDIEELEVAKYHLKEAVDTIGLCYNQFVGLQVDLLIYDVKTNHQTIVKTLKIK